MATQGVKPLGVTPPLYTGLPTEAEKEVSFALVEELKRQNNYESPAEQKKRDQVLKSLQSIAEEFIRVVLRSKNYSENIVKSAGGKIETFGSYKLGVIGPGSDIDALLVGPESVYHQDFFEFFPDVIHRMAPEGAITDFTPKPDAFAPCITFKYSDIDIDLLYARIASHKQITKDLSMLSREMLRGLGETEVRSLNGVRVADEILNLVPEPSTFRTALRVIKLWGTRRAISGNMYGFPGGVAFAILVARVCQLYPKATSATIVLKFFKILEKWQWPMPVLLKPIENDSKMGFKVWNPKIYHGDKNHIMPIITPAYPSMCTTHNFSLSTQAVILKEVKRGGEIMDKIMMNKAQWKELFAKHTFFTAGYKYYLTVVSASTTEESQLLWSGFVESKVRLLVSKLDEHPSLALSHPFNKGYSRVHRCRTEEEIEEVKKGSLKYQAKDIATATTGHGLTLQGAAKDEAVNGDGDAKDDENIRMVYTTTNYIGLELREGAKSLDLSWQVESFKSLCRQWTEYKEDLNALSIVHIRNFDLPDDVFGEGETKPVRTTTKRAHRAAHGQKRPSTEDSEPPAKRQQTSAVVAG